MTKSTTTILAKVCPPQLVRASCGLALLLALLGCDPEHKDKCEWYLVPELDHLHLVSGDWVPLCARNYETKKQKCYLTAKLDFAEKVYGKTFRFSSMELETGGPPRKIKELKLCQSKP